MPTFSNTCTGNQGSHYTQYLTVNYSNYDIPNNRTWVEITYSRTRQNSNYYNYGYANPSHIYINGSEVASATPYSAHNNYETQTLCTWSGYIYHENDGTKSFNVSASFSSSSANLSGGSVSGSVTLPTIPRTSGVTCASFNIGDSTIISIDRKSSSFTHTIDFSFGNYTGRVAYRTGDTTVGWTPNTSSMYAQIPNTKSGTGTITCYTYSGDTHIGTSTTTFTAYAKESDCKPDVSATIIDTNNTTIALTNDSSKFIKYFSKPKVTISATPKYSSSISSYSTSINDGQSSQTQETIFNTIAGNQITVSTTDSRGFSKNETYTLDMVDYVKLAYKNISIQRTEQMSSEVKLNLEGYYFNGSFGNSSNQLNMYWQYRESGSSSWITGGALLPTINNNNTFTITNCSLGNMFDYQKEYQFKIIATDNLMTIGNTTAEVQTVTKGLPVVRIGDEYVNINGDLYINGVSLTQIIQDIVSR